jgi:hypothetical protein
MQKGESSIPARPKAERTESDPFTARRAATMTTPSSNGGSSGFTFDGTGDYQAWKAWARGVALFGRADPVKAAEKVFMNLRGTAAEMVMGQAAATGDPFPDTNAIINALDLGYAGSTGIGQQEADRRLMRLRQKNMTFADYVIEFQTLATQSSFSRQAKISALMAGVNGKLAPAAAMLEPDVEVGTAITKLRQYDAMTPNPVARTKTEGRSKGKAARGKKVREARDMSTIECYNCHKKGHLKKDCRSKAKKAKEPAQEDDDDYEDIVEHQAGNE